ncbi:sarcosine oxidase subunit delta [Jannaschia sp. W003]|uniref:sarcosine oxidase subunit delta n=1 Tax=Jannaschia sp. W003 TaxID=2867012 RepID=UPI0021A54C56|nr:sarcosine oxidase subunit delta [Jannaschia sp. W003]UWQ21495.1 sarcosine oxidase subunit delta [Jannaschia sp. W003]
MLIDHPLLGPRDASEFTFMGDAALLRRPEDGDVEALADYVYLRDNPAGRHRELWLHEMGDRSLLVVERDTTTHEIHAVRLARGAPR